MQEDARPTPDEPAGYGSPSGVYERIEVTVPDIGNFADVPVIEVHVAAGDTVAAEDPLITLESDKATMDIPAPAAGTIIAVRVAVGDTVSAGHPIADLETGQKLAAPRRTAATGAAPAPAARGARGDVHAEVLVLGAGPGGYTAAFRAADLGQSVVLADERPALGGVCLNVGCIPSKALLHAARVIAETREMAAHGVRFGDPDIDLDALRGWKDGVVSRLTGGLAGLARQRKVTTAAGHRPVRLPEPGRGHRRRRQRHAPSASTAPSSRPARPRCGCRSCRTMTAGCSTRPGRSTWRRCPVACW